MSVKIRFSSATISRLVLAKVGNPQREEPLQTSKEVFRVKEEDQPTLTALFLKPFKNLMPHRFHHHSSLDQHEMNGVAKAVFDAPSKLLPKGIEIAQRLYAKSNHPNIKSGDLCIALVDEIEADGELIQGLCILKAESMAPFLSITANDGDLELHTEQGINPERIDKGCLILNLFAQKGFYALTFDRSGADSKFWVREFLGLQAVPDSAFLTNTYANLVTDYLAHEAKPEEAPEETFVAARDALAFFDGREHFDLQEFEEKVLRTPEAIATFAEHKARLEEEHGLPLDTSFEISPKHVNKAVKKLSAVVKLDTGVEIHFKNPSDSPANPVVERGYDDKRKMNFIKVFFNEVTETE
ncbi:MAG: nucleoid-associated protein [Verrucomicrobiaceae bacterium]|nr:nucleoid-associated protein [Verrucomicrobiaceae bacterium]